MIIEKGYLKYNDLVFPVNLPSSLISTLIKEDILEDINQEETAKEGFKFLDKDISFSFDFNVSENDLKKEYAYLNLSHVDTIADVYLNNQFLTHLENAHRTYRYSIKNLLNEGLNNLVIKIYSSINYLKTKQEEYPLWGLGEPNVVEGYGHIRRCYCTFGWDWAPKLPDIGIDDVISLDFFDDLVFDVITSQIHHQNSVDLIINSLFLGENPSNYALFNPDGVIIVEGTLSTHVEIKIDNPMLWWPRNMGGQPLYKLVIYKGSFHNEIFLGLREVKLIRQEDQLGESFYFLINKKPIFMVGANYIPTSLILPYTDSKITSKRIIEECCFANFNSLRIWGGGIYPDESLYLEADKKGILIFQDFMFSGTGIRLNEEFKENVFSEVKEKVISLANHPSIFLWCGNNECEFFLSLWQNDPYMKQNPNMAQMLEDNVTLFEKIIPEILNNVFSDLPYIPSSQSKHGSYSLMDNDLIGDSHSWDVWAGCADYEKYFSHQSRFCDEFGFASLPDKKTFEQFSSSLNSIYFHEVHGNGYNNIKDYLSRYYSENEDLVYYSQINQSDAICSMINHLRSNRPTCMGSYYWCLNDIWPSIALSSLDYYGHRKALHYKLNRIQKPLQIVYDIKKNHILFYLDNNSSFEEQVRVNIRIKKCDFTTLQEYSDVYILDETSNTRIIDFDIDELKEKGAHFISYGIDNEIEESYCLYRNKDLPKRDLKTSIFKSKSGITIKSESYLRNVMVFYKDHPLGDLQCFDIVDKQGIMIELDDFEGVDTKEITIKLS